MNSTPHHLREGEAPGEPHPSTIKVGDKVNWTDHREYASGQIRFTARFGLVLAVHNDRALVRLKNGRDRELHVSRLRKEGQPSALTPPPSGLCALCGLPNS